MFSYLRQWIIPIIGTFVLALAYQGTNLLWAAPLSSELYQTVPIPTPRPLDTAVPTVTPAKDDGDSPTATPTRTPSATTPAGDDNGATETPIHAATSVEPGQTPAESAPATTAPPVIKQMAVVVPIVLNVRSGPGTDSAVVGTLFQGDAVEVQGRSGTWWLICCPLGATQPGWVDSKFLDPDFDTTQINTLIPEQAGATTATNQSGAGVSTQALADSQLRFQITHDPVYVWAGQTLEMTFTVTNTGTLLAEQIRIRDEFPLGLIIEDAMISDGGQIEVSTTRTGTSLLIARWSELAVGDAVTVTATLVVDGETAMGTVIDNLAIAEAANASGVTAGITIGMPPATLPEFR